jgi:hypothetical protein
LDGAQKLISVVTLQRPEMSVKYHLGPSSASVTPDLNVTIPAEDKLKTIKNPNELI